MAAVLPITPSVNMMEDNPAWIVILANFGLAVRSIDRLTEDYLTANDLMASNVEKLSLYCITKIKYTGVTQQQISAAT